MEHEESLRKQAAWLERQLWRCARRRLAALRAGLPARLATAGVTLTQVLARLSDEALALAVRKDFLADEAFEELFVNRYQQPFYRWYRRRGAQPADAADLVGTLIYNFYKNRFRTYRARGPRSCTVRAYLWRAAHNLHIQWLRKQLPGPLDSCPEPLAYEPTPEQQLLGAELEEQLEAALGRLKQPDERIMRAVLDGRGLPDIVRAEDLSYPAVSMRLFRARRFLAQELRLERDRTALGPD